MRRARRRQFALALLGLALAAVGAGSGCAAPTFEPQPLLYSDRAPIPLAVDRVEVVDESGSARTPFEQGLDIPPALAAKSLLQSRLNPVGGDGRVRAVITEAAVERRELPMRTGLVGLFTIEPEAVLTGRLGVRIDVVAPEGLSVASITSATSLRRTVPENATDIERREIAYELVRDLVDQLDAGLESNIRQNLARYVASLGAG